MRGDTPLTSRLLQPVLVDARSAEPTAAPALPWYLDTLLVSQPLHFGDHGGLPLKLIWALLDIVTILVLGSAVGLVAALVGDGPWDLLSWLALLPPPPLVLAAWHGLPWRGAAR